MRVASIGAAPRTSRRHRGTFGPSARHIYRIRFCRAERLLRKCRRCTVCAAFASTQGKDVKIRRMIVARGLMISAHHAVAQTCASPDPLYGEVSNVAGDTCPRANELGTVCIFNSSPANDYGYSLTLTNGYTATQVALTNNTPPWNAAMLLLQGSCNGNTPCPRNADANGAGGNEALDMSNLAVGNYLMLVTSTNGDTGCGSYSLTVNGTFPVALESFDVI